VFDLLTARFRNSDFPKNTFVHAAGCNSRISSRTRRNSGFGVRHMVRYAFRKGTEKNRLLAAGRRVCEATENLAVFGRAAHFLDSRQTAQLRRGADYNEFQTVLDGLAALVACYGRGARRRGRMETHRAASLAASTGRRARGGENFVIDIHRKEVLYINIHCRKARNGATPLPNFKAHVRQVARKGQAGAVPQIHRRPGAL